MRNLLLSFVLILLNFQLLSAQSEQTVRLEKFEFKENSEDYKTMQLGLKFKFDIRFSRYVEEYAGRSYKLFWQLEDASGATVYDSRLLDGSDRKKSISPNKPWRDQSATYMVDDNVQLIIPYRNLELEAGKHDLVLVLSLRGEYDKFPEFARKKFSFTFQPVEIHKFSEQELTVTDLKFEHNEKGFGVKEKGVHLVFDLNTKYSPNEMANADFEITWEIRDLSGKRLFYSPDAKSIHHQDKNIYPRQYDDKKAASIKLFSQYTEIKMDGPAEVEIVFVASMGNGEKKEFYKATHLLEVPQKYSFEEQEFTLTNIEAGHGVRNGSSGLKITFHCAFKYFTIRKDPDRGSYYFSASVKDEAGKTIYSLGKPGSGSIGSTQAYAPRIPSEEHPELDIEIFLPYRKLSLKEGNHDLNFTLNVCDKVGTFKFPTLGKGRATVQQPRIKTLKVHLSRLSVLPSNYDSEVGPFGSREPDLKWHLYVGKDNEYSSRMLKNSLIGPTGTVTVKLADADELSIVLYDEDSGLFNRDDLLGRWQIMHAEKGKRFSHIVDSQGLIERLEIAVDELE